MLGSEVAWRLIAFLRIVECAAGDHVDAVADDALLDAWFGRRPAALRPDSY